jgi:hypothetical protein
MSLPRFAKSLTSIGSSSWRGGMHTLAESVEVLAVDASCTTDTLTVVLSDGRAVSAPLAWFPRLLEATPRQRADWELIGGGIGLHWEAVDEDTSVASLLHPENFVRLPHTRMQPTRKNRRVHGRSRYDALREYLESKATREVMLKFKDAAEVLGFRLPPAAHKYRAFWANQSDNTNRPQARAWQEAGYEVDSCRLSEMDGWVRFRRRGR